MIIRRQYVDTLRKYRDMPLVKVLAGIRRCGKSTILDMLRNDLISSGQWCGGGPHYQYALYVSGF